MREGEGERYLKLKVKAESDLSEAVLCVEVNTVHSTVLSLEHILWYLYRNTGGCMGSWGMSV